MKGQCLGADNLVVASSPCENWCSYILSQYDKSLSRYNEKQFQRQLTVPPLKQTSLQNTYMEETYFTFFLTQFIQKTVFFYNCALLSLNRYHIKNMWASIIALNFFVTEVPIIQKPVHGFGLQINWLVSIW